MSYAVLAGCIASSGVEAVGRSLYWVGGSASWDGTAGSKWALTSGGTGGQAIPTSIDNVHIDANSGAVTVTIATVAANCRNLDFTGFTGTFAGSTASNIFGSLTLATGMTRSYTGAITFTSTWSGRTITLNGKSIASTITFNGIGGAWTLQDNLNNSSSFTLTNGSLNTNGKTVTGLTFSSTNSNVRSLIAGASTFNLSGNVTFTISTNLTLSLAPATFNLTGTATVFDLGSTAASISALNFSGTASSTPATPSLINRSGSDVTIGTLTRSVLTSNAPLVLSGNFTVTNTLSLVGADVRNSRVQLINANPGITCQITATGATKTFTNIDFYGITAVGNTPWTGTSMGDAGGNTGITFDTPVTRYLVTIAGNNSYVSTIWATSSGGSVGSGVTNPLPQDTIVIDSNSFTNSGTTFSLLNAPCVTGLDFTNATNNPTLSVDTQVRIFGDLKIISGMTASGSGSLIFNKWSGTQTLTTAGLSIGFGITCLTGGTLVFADAVTNTSASGIGCTAGTLNDGNFNIAINSSSTAFQLFFTPLNSTKVFHKGTGTYTLSGAGIWNVIAGSTTNLTFTDSGLIKETNNSSSTKSFSPGGLTYNNFWNATAGTGVINMNTGANNSTWNDFKIDAGRTQQFGAATTTTFSTLTAVGTVGNVITLQSSTAASHNLVSSSGTSVNCDYMTITNSHASGATFTATNSTDGGGNTGWVILPTGFLSSWKTNNAGISASNQVQLPFVASGTYNCTVYWGDGTSDVITTWNQAQTLHTYASPGTYKISITGTCHGFAFNSGGDCLKLLNISKWDILRLGNDTSYFAGCINLTITATDNLDLTGTTDLSYLFLSCGSITTIPSINTWTTSSVTNFQGMFYGCSSFDQLLSFNTSAGTSMRNMFNGCTAFNSPITLTTINVTDFSYMFDFCSVFNQSVGFNTTAATAMDYMFDNCSAFNQNISEFVITSLISAAHMMDGVTLSNANYNALLVGWSGQTTPKTGVVFSAGNSHYSGTGIAARGILTATYGWTITDGGTP